MAATVRVCRQLTGMRLVPSRVRLVHRRAPTPELAEWRGIPEGEDCYSPNAWDEFNSVPSLVAFISKLQEATGKPVGFKCPIGTEDFIRVPWPAAMIRTEGALTGSSYGREGAVASALERAGHMALEEDLSIPDG